MYQHNTSTPKPTAQWHQLQTGGSPYLFLPTTPVQTLPWAPPVKPMHGIPTAWLARTRCPRVTWLSQPHSTHWQTPYRSQNESIPPSYRTHPQNMLPLHQMRHPDFISITAVTLGRMLNLCTPLLSSSGTKGVRDHMAFRGKTASVVESFIKRLCIYFCGIVHQRKSFLQNQIHTY